MLTFIEGLGIVGSSDTPHWRAQRRLVLTLLRNTHLLGIDIELLVKNQAIALMDKFAKYNGPFNPKKDIYVAVSNVTNSILMGKTFEYDDEKFLSFVDLVQEVFEYWAAGTLNYHVSFLAHLPLKTNRRANDAIKRMFDFIVKVVDHERRSFNPSDKPRNLIQYILRERKDCMSKVSCQLKVGDQAL